jgi:glycosidase
MMRLCFITGVFLLRITDAFAQSNYHAYPTHWWVGMKEQKLQILIRASKIGAEKRTVTVNYPGVSLVKQTGFRNTGYLAIDLKISAAAKPGKIRIDIINPDPAANYSIGYELKARNKGNGNTRIRGIGQEDLIYLIMPDRFSNGDPSNDRVSGLKDQSLNRADFFQRHGGDLKGIEDHLDYLQEIGVTALWLNPVIENDMPERTEHGYAFTDHYEIDKRLGGKQAYLHLIDALHARKMKIIQDAVYNHVGIEHFLFRDLPDSSWFHWWPQYTNTTYKDQTLMDPYASASDKKKMSDGWFVPSMPDLNQQNPYVASFLIQHAIWCTEEFGLDGWRIDTYAYNDLNFMNRCNQALLNEFPRLHMFGETWVHGIPNQSFFTRNVYDIPFKSNLPGVTDFQLNLYGIVPALTQGFGWTEGVNRLYLTATNDFVYKDPARNVIFLDNHDLSRFFSVIGEDLQKYKIALGWLLTFRGIPQLYYGAEILMKNFANPDGLVRLDFPGGWQGDTTNKFKASGRTASENEVFDWVKKLASFRKNSSAITKGKMMQFVPEDGVYVYFRYSNEQTVMCIMNTNEKEITIDGRRFEERTASFSKGRDIVSGTLYQIKQTIPLPPKTMLVLELQK